MSPAYIRAATASSFAVAVTGTDNSSVKIRATSSESGIIVALQGVRKLTFAGTKLVRSNLALALLEAG